MINSKYFADYFTDLLNTYGSDYGKNFKIYADEGELKAEVKTYGETPIQYTSGIAEIIGSTMVPLRDLKLDTYTLQLKLFVDLQLNGFSDENESNNLNDVRDILTNIVSTLNGVTVTQTENDIVTKMTLSFEYPTIGNRTNVGFINDCLIMYLNVDIAVFNEGINSNEGRIVINNEEISFTTATITRKKTAQQYDFKGSENSQTIIESQGISIDIVLPTTTGNVSSLIMNDILNGGNEALNVYVETPLASRRFIGTFGDDSVNLNIAKNMGYNISIVESRPNVLKYSDEWKIQTSTTATESITTTKANSTIYWGDNSVDFAEEIGTYTHTYTDNKSTHTIRIYEG